MELRILGAHNVESRDTRLSSLLIDGVLAVDAGGLTSTLSLEEQAGVKAILLSHYHYDHIRDVAAIGLNNSYSLATTGVYASADTLDVLSRHLINGVLYPRFVDTPFPDRPALRLFPLEPYGAEDIEGYRVLPLPVPHSVPAVGFEIRSPDGKSLFYGGDSGPGCASVWQKVSPQLMVLDVTMPNMLEDYAPRAGHLTPRLLAEELEQFARAKGYLPRIVLVHLSPYYEERIREEVAEFAERLGASITLGWEGMGVEL